MDKVKATREGGNGKTTTKGTGRNKPWAHTHDARADEDPDDKGGALGWAGAPSRQIQQPLRPIHPIPVSSLSSLARVTVGKRRAYLDVDAGARAPPRRLGLEHASGGVRSRWRRSRGARRSTESRCGRRDGSGGGFDNSSIRHLRNRSGFGSAVERRKMHRKLVSMAALDDAEGGWQQPARGERRWRRREGSACRAARVETAGIGREGKIISRERSPLRRDIAVFHVWAPPHCSQQWGVTAHVWLILSDSSKSPRPSPFYNFFQSPRIRAIMSAVQGSTCTAGALLGTRWAHHYPSNSNLSCNAFRSSADEGPNREAILVNVDDWAFAGMRRSRYYPSNPTLSADGGMNREAEARSKEPQTCLVSLQCRMGARERAKVEKKNDSAHWIATASKKKNGTQAIAPKEGNDCEAGREEQKDKQKKTHPFTIRFLANRTPCVIGKASPHCESISARPRLQETKRKGRTSKWKPCARRASFRALSAVRRAPLRIGSRVLRSNRASSTRRLVPTRVRAAGDVTRSLERQVWRGERESDVATASDVGSVCEVDMRKALRRVGVCSIGSGGSEPGVLGSPPAGRDRGGGALELWGSASSAVQWALRRRWGEVLNPGTGPWMNVHFQCSWWDMSSALGKRQDSALATRYTQDMCITGKKCEWSCSANVIEYMIKDQWRGRLLSWTRQQTFAAEWASRPAARTNASSTMKRGRRRVDRRALATPKIAEAKAGRHQDRGSKCEFCCSAVVSGLPHDSESSSKSGQLLYLAFMVSVLVVSLS
ncbi:hypothetical protein C8R45DRAFT_946758 [Mycena sanguinolenta]|nr:hypothetical protein C8R45DRAFT_946758 [Mycena sanguinolenta]